MKKIIDFKDNRGVMSLIVILGIGLFVLAIALTLTGQIVVEIMRGRNTIAGDQSFFTAEAAAREGVYQFMSTTSYSGGNFEEINNIIAGISIATSTWPNRYATATAVATNNLTNRIVKYIIDTYPGGSAFDKVLYAGGTIILPSNNSTKNIAGDIYAQDNILNIDNIANHGDFATSGVEYIDSPEIDRDDILNQTAYSMYASTTSPALRTYIENNYNTFSDTIIFASGTAPLTLNLDGVLEVKALIVEGDFTLTGQNSEIKGLVYVVGTTTISVNGPDKKPITGALICLGNIIVPLGGKMGSGNDSGVYYDPLIASVWQDLVGPITLGASTPRIVRWQQE